MNRVRKLIELLTDSETKRKNDLLAKYKQNPASLSDQEKSELGELSGRDSLDQKVESLINEEERIFTSNVELRISSADFRVYLGEEIESIVTNSLNVKWNTDIVSQRSGLVITPSLLTQEIEIEYDFYSDDETLEKRTETLKLDSVNCEISQNGITDNFELSPTILEIDFEGKDIVVGKLIF
jgi:hypothetical protein